MSLNRSPESPPDGHSAPEQEDPLARLLSEIGALVGHSTHYAQAQFDLAKGRVRRLAFWLILGAAAAILVAVAAVTSVVLLLRGVSRGLAAALGDRLWLGDLLTGVLFFALTAGGASLVVRRGRAARANKLIDRYGNRDFEHPQRANEHGDHTHDDGGRTGLPEA